jgi:hypothetical protein
MSEAIEHNPRRFLGLVETDDVVDLFFSIYTNRKVADKVGPHSDLPGEFPHLGPPHTA